MSFRQWALSHLFRILELNIKNAELILDFTFPYGKNFPQHPEPSLMEALLL
jgi:hypothetical protein